MVKAIWNDVVIVESDATIVVEGSHYFLLESVNQAYLRPNDHYTTCVWKGVASYYDLEVDGQTNSGAAWHYPNPSEAATHIKDYVAFWKGAMITE